jgi:hypothetical protein
VPKSYLDESLAMLRGGGLPEEPSLFSRGFGAVSSVLGAPKAGLDWLSRQSAENIFGIPDTGASPGQMLRAAAGLDPSDPSAQGYGARLAGKGLEFGTDLGTDPTLPLSFGTGTVGKVATGALTGIMAGSAVQEGARAFDTIRDEGFTPEAAEEALGATLGAGGAFLGGRHLYKGLKSDALVRRDARAKAAAEAAALEASQPKPFATTGTEFLAGPAPAAGTGFGRLDFDSVPQPMGVLPTMVPEAPVQAASRSPYQRPLEEFGFPDMGTIAAMAPERPVVPAPARSGSAYAPSPEMFSFDQPMGRIQAAVPEAPAPVEAPRPAIRAKDQAEAQLIADRIGAEDFKTLRGRLRQYEKSLMLDSAELVRSELARRSSPVPEEPLGAPPPPGLEPPAEVVEPRYAYRARDTGELGVPDKTHSQASLDEADVRRIAPSRSEGPQEIVRFDLNKLAPEDYEIIERPDAPAWVRLRRPLEESSVEKLGDLTDVDRAAASKAELLPEPQRQAVRMITDSALTDPGTVQQISEKLGMPPEAVIKGAEDIKADGTRELQPEAVAIKRAAIQAANEINAAAPSPDVVGATVPESGATDLPPAQSPVRNLTPEAAAQDPTFNPDLTQPFFHPDLTQPLPPEARPRNRGFVMPEKGNVKLPTIYQPETRVPEGSISTKAAEGIPAQVEAIRGSGVENFPLISRQAERAIKDATPATVESRVSVPAKRGRLTELPHDELGSPIIPGQEDWSPERRAAVRGAAQMYAQEAKGIALGEKPRQARPIMGPSQNSAASNAFQGMSPGVTSALKNTPLEGIGSPKQILDALKRDKGNALEKRVLEAVDGDVRAEELEVGLRESVPDAVEPKGDVDTSFDFGETAPKPGRIFDGDGALSRLKARGNTAKAGGGLSFLEEGAGAIKDVATYGASLIENGIRDFGAWSKEMLSQLGEAIGPRLREFYEQAVSLAKSAGRWIDEKAGSETGAVGSNITPLVQAQAAAKGRPIKPIPPPSQKQANAPPPSAKAAATPPPSAAADVPVPTKGDKALEVWKAGLVSAPGTQIANILGNVGEQLIRVGETAVGSVVDRVIGGPRTRIGREASVELGGAMKGASKAMGRLVSDLRDIATLQPERANDNTPADFRAGAIGGKTGRAVRTPFRLLGAFDQFFQEVGGSAELHKLAMRKAGGDATKAASLVANPTPDMLEAVSASKKSRTFQDPNKIAEALIKFRKDHKWMNVVLPFVQTPANITARTIERSPLGFRQGYKALAAYRKAVKLDAAPDVLERLKSEAVDKLTRPLVGTMILGTFATAAKAGLMTGGGPTDPKAKNLLKSTGWQPYSFVVGDTYIPFNRFQPVSSILGLAADMVEATNSKDANDLFEKGIGSVMEGFVSQSYVQGFADAAAFVNDPMQFSGQYVSGLAGSLVPNVVSKINQAIDPKMRDARPEESGLVGLPERSLKTVMSRVPGLAQMLPERRDGTGEVIERPGNALTRALLPVQPSQKKPGKALEELMSDISAVPGAPSREVKANGREIRWTEDEYDALQKADLKATEELRSLIQTSAFRRLNPEDQKQQLDSVRSKYRRAAKQKIMATPSFRRRALASA